MAYDDVIGQGFHGFLQSDKPLKLIQRKDSLLAQEDELSEQTSSSQEESTVNVGRKRKSHNASSREQLSSFRKGWPFFRKKETRTDDELKPTKEVKSQREIEEKPSHRSQTRKPTFIRERLNQRRTSYRPIVDKDDDRGVDDEEVEDHEVDDETFPSSEEISIESSEESEASEEHLLTQSETQLDQKSNAEISEEGSSYEESTVIDIPEDEDDVPTIQFPKTKVKSYRKRSKGIGKCFTYFCPCLSRLLFSKRKEYRGIKAMLGFPVGVLFGFALQKLVLERLQLSPFASRTLGRTLALCLGFGCALSTQVRCITFLTIPALCGKTGRAYVSTFVITFIITGPISNILSNAKESMRVMTCIGSLNLNHTVERFKLMFKPVKEIVWDFVGASKKIEEGTKGIEGAYKEIDREVRDEEEVKMEMAETDELDKEVGQESRVGVIKKKFSGFKAKFGDASESKYGLKSEIRCEGIFTKGVKGCYNSFGAAYDRCHGYLPIIGYLLCWPMKLTFICDIAGSYLGKRACDSGDAMSPGFGESMDTADGVQKEFDKELGVGLQYKLDIPVEKVDQITPQDISASVRHQFEKRKRGLDFFLNIITRVLALMFLQVFHVSRKYCNQYLRVIEFDNKYITSYFRHIDARRHKQGKKTLLPLKKGEKLELTEPFKVKFSTEEKVLMIFNTVRLIGEVMTVSILLAFDWIFYEFLMLIQRHAHVTYYQTGVHHIKMTIYGDGFIGNMVRSILKGFDKKHTMDKVTSTAACLPQPTKLDELSVVTLYCMFLALFVLMLTESFALRLRRVICSFFYPKREKKRVLFLYNDRLKKRISYMQHMRNRVRQMARQQAIALDTGVFFSLRHLYPKYFGWLVKLGLGKRKCLICEEVESKKVPFVICSEECPFCYCPECWDDMKGKCYVCMPDDDEDSPLSEEDWEPDGEE